MDKFCNKLKELRKDNNLSVLALSKILSVNHSTILRWESGEISPSIDHLINICNHFGVSADYMLGLED